MALDFPNSPDTNETYTPVGLSQTYMWDGTKWVLQAPAGAGIQNPLTSDLDVGNYGIVSSDNGDIDVTPNGTGNVSLGSFTFDADQVVGAGQDNYVFTYDNATGLISLEPAPGASGGDAWGDLVDADIVPDADGTRDLGSSANRFAELHVDSILANGDGNVVLGNFSFDADQTVGAGQDNHVLTYDNATGLISLEAAAGGGGISSLGGQTGASQTFANDTNLQMVSSGNVHTLTWSGTLAGSRIADGAVTNAKRADMAQATISGRAAGAGTGTPTDLTPTQARTILNVENGATADQTNAEIETAYNAQVAQVSPAERTAGTETGVRRFSPADVASMAGTHGGGAPEGTEVLSTGELGGSKFLREDGDGTCSWQAIPGGGDALTSSPLSQFAATTSAQLAGVMSDETGSGALVFGTSPTIATPTLTLKQASSPTPTGEGDIQWDTDDNRVVVGDGVGTKVFSDDAVVQARANHTGTQLLATISDAGTLAAKNTIDNGDWSGADLEIANGGTGASSEAAARSNLGLAIGTDVQAHSAVLDATTASFTAADETKLDGIEAGADSSTREYCWVIKKPAVGTIPGPKLQQGWTVGEVEVAHAGTMNSADINVEERTARGSAGTNILASELTSTTAGASVTSGFNNASLAAGNYLYLDISAVGGTVGDDDYLTVTVQVS